MQEVLERDLASLAALGPYEAKYAVSARVERPDPDDKPVELNWGVAVLTRLPVQAQVVSLLRRTSRRFASCANRMIRDVWSS